MGTPKAAQAEEQSQEQASESLTFTRPVVLGPETVIVTVNSPEAYIFGRMQRDIMGGLASLSPAHQEAVKDALFARSIRNAEKAAEKASA